MAFMDVKQDLSFWGLLGSFGVVIVGFFLVFTGGGSSVQNVDPVLKCSNPECSYTEQLTKDALKERKEADFETFRETDPEKAQALIDYTAQSGMGRMMMLGPGGGGDDFDASEQAETMLKNGMGQISGQAIPFICPDCSNQSVYTGMICRNPDKECGAIFLRNPVAERGQYGDRCPKCKYSRAEVSHKKRQAEKKGKKGKKNKRKK